MRKLLLLAVIVVVVALAVYRDRLYVRDPMAKVERNGVLQSDTRVFINYSNDVLVQENGGAHMFVVQHTDRLPRMPSGLNCIQGMACITPEEQPISARRAERPDADAPVEERRLASMSDRQVTFVDADGTGVRVEIR